MHTQGIDAPPGTLNLHPAIEELEDGGSLDVLILLLRHRADVDGWDQDVTATPLLMAFFRHQWAAVRVLLDTEAVRALLSAGADPETPDSDLRLARDPLPQRTPATSAAWDRVAVMLALGPDASP